MGVAEDLADALARDVLDAQARIDDDRFYEKVAKVIGASSPTFQEAFLTSIRIRLAAARGREFLSEALGELKIVETAQSASDAQAAKDKATAAEEAANPKPPEPVAPAKPVLSAAANAKLISESAFGPAVPSATGSRDF
jgi:hypothetical protein